MSASLRALRPVGGFGLIMADPAWSFKTYSDKGKGKSADRHYSVMTLDEIARLPVADVAAEDCLLWLWCTNPMLDQGFEILREWGFTFKTAGHWVKRTKHGKLAFGTGYIFRSAGEPYLIGTRGKPRTTRSTRSVIEARVREHSRKPDEAYAACEALIPGAKRLDMFSRENRAGWASWGNQAGQFDQTEAAL